MILRFVIFLEPPLLLQPAAARSSMITTMGLLLVMKLHVDCRLQSHLAANSCRYHMFRMTWGRGDVSVLVIHGHSS